ncbi:MAG: AraC family transcriptional regulator [Kofleriaceae bacterium]
MTGHARSARSISAAPRPSEEGALVDSSLAMTDALSSMLEAFRIRGTVYFWANFAPPWGVQVPQFESVVRYHLVLRGTCAVAVDGDDEVVQLEPGDMIAVPHGRSHSLSDRPGRPLTTLDRLLRDTKLDDTGARVIPDRDAGLATRLVCGHFAHDGDDEHPVFRMLPSAIVVRGIAPTNARWLEDGLRMISHEVADNGAGATAIVTRLSEILFIRTLRSYVETHPERMTGWAGFVDPNLGRALAKIHDDPGRAWTVAALAKLAGLSRTRFAVRFRELMGQTPLDYVARWRMIRARGELCDESRSVAEVGRALGYQSEAAFHRAFQRRYGMGPGAFRRSRLAPGESSAPIDGESDAGAPR